MSRGYVVDHTERNWQAECIYRLFRQYQPDIEYVIDGIMTIENFENGRERGYTIRYKDKEVSFAENRSSDDIVVYPFKWENNDTLDDDYSTKSKYFKREQFLKVFDWILGYLNIKL